MIANVRRKRIGVNGDAHDFTNTHNTNSPFITSDTAPDLALQGALDLGQFTPGGVRNDSVVISRCIGTLTTGACKDATTCTGFCSAVGWQHYVDLYEPDETQVVRDPVIFTFNRTVNGTHDPTVTKGKIIPKYDVIKQRRASQLFDEGIRIVAQKPQYAPYFNLTKVLAFHRSPQRSNGLGPYLVTDDGLTIVCDSNPSLLLESDDYFAGIPHPTFPDLKGYPQKTGTILNAVYDEERGTLSSGTLVDCDSYNCTGLETVSWPHIDETRGIDNNNRHIALNPLCYVLDSTTLEMRDAFPFADIGMGNRNMTRTEFDEHSRGFVQPYAGGRQPIYGKCVNKPYSVLITQSSFMDTLRSDWYQTTAGDPLMVQMAQLSGNIPTRRNQFSVWKVWNNASGVKVEFWQKHYNTPEWNYKNQINPYTGLPFASDAEAVTKNFRSDGVWTPGMFLNETSCEIVVAWSNGHGATEEFVMAAVNANAPVDVRGGRCLADTPPYDRMLELAAIKNMNAHEAVAAIQVWGRDNFATSNCQREAVKQMPTYASYDSKYHANGWARYDLNSGEVGAQFSSRTLDNFVAVSWNWYFYADTSKIPREIRFNLLAEGGDSDAHAVVYSKAINKFVAFRKDATIVTMDTQTLQPDCFVQAGIPTSAGTINYNMAADEDGENVFFGTMNSDAFGPGFGNYMHRTYLNRTSGEPVVEVTWGEGLYDTPYATNVSLDNGKPRVRIIDPRDLLLQRVNLRSCKITGLVTLATAAEYEKGINTYIPFSVPVVANKDLICAATGFAGKIKCYDMMTMRLRFEFDAFKMLNETTVLPPGRDYLFANVAPFFVGNTMYIVVTEGFFPGNVPGRWLVGVDIKYPANATVSRIPDDVPNHQPINPAGPHRKMDPKEIRAAIANHNRDLYYYDDGLGTKFNK